MVDPEQHAGTSLSGLAYALDELIIGHSYDLRGEFQHCIKLNPARLGNLERSSLSGNSRTKCNRSSQTFLTMEWVIVSQSRSGNRKVVGTE
jgi:hypothetical protein